MRNKRKMGYVFLMSLLILCCSSTTVFAADTSAEYVPQLYATIWSLVPPVVAIVLALITKEVYSSLFVGIFDWRCIFGQDLNRKLQYYMYFRME